MTGVKTIAFHVGALVLAFSAAHTAGTLMLGYRRGVTVLLGWSALPAIDAEALNQIASACVAVLVWAIAAWRRRATLNRQRQKEAAAEQSDRALSAVRQGLLEAGFDLGSNGPPHSANTLSSRITALESQVNALQAKSKTETSE